jgi:hypothetical protein
VSATLTQSRAQPSPIFLINGNRTQDNGGNTIGFSAACAAGALLVALFSGTGTSPKVTAVADNAGSTWVEATTASTTNATLGEVLQVWYCLSAVSGAQNLTVSSNGANSGTSLSLFEFALGGATATLGAITSNTTSTGTPTFTLTPNAANSIGLSLWNTTGGEATGITSGWTLLNTTNSNWYDHCASNPDLGAVGSKTVTPTGIGSAPWQGAFATFDLSAGGGATNIAGSLVNSPIVKGLTGGALAA